MKGKAKGAASLADGAEAEALAYEAAQTPEPTAKARSATAENERRISKWAVWVALISERPLIVTARNPPAGVSESIETIRNNRPI